MTSAPAAASAPVTDAARTAEVRQARLRDLVERVERAANGSPATCLADAAEVRSLARELGDTAAEIKATYFLGYAQRLLSEDDQALASIQESLELAQAVGDQVWEASALCGLGSVHANLGDYETALELQEQSLAIRRAIEDDFGVAVSLNNLGITLRDLGLFPERAREMFADSRALFERLGHEHCVADSMSHLAALDVAAAERAPRADLELRTRTAAEAAETARAAVVHAQTDGGNRRLVADSAVALGRPQRA